MAGRPDPGRGRRRSTTTRTRAARSTVRYVVRRTQERRRRRVRERSRVTRRRSTAAADRAAPGCVRERRDAQRHRLPRGRSSPTRPRSGVHFLHALPGPAGASPSQPVAGADHRERPRRRRRRGSETIAVTGVLDGRRGPHGERRPARRLLALHRSARRRRSGPTRPRRASTRSCRRSRFSFKVDCPSGLRLRRR